jgi:succinate-semialdehyde dehydrogenase/glutarate-semialdehyde dehydrogenase
MSNQPAYKDTQLFIDGKWTDGDGGKPMDVLNPANNERIGAVSVASNAQLGAAVEAAGKGFQLWKNTSVLERSAILRKAAALLRENVDATAYLLTLEQGKPLIEARTEVNVSADIFDWFAEEARRTYGRIIPARDRLVRQSVFREPVGPVAAFTPWNFPVSQTARKLGAALAAGCSLVVKPSEDTPAAVAVLARVLQEAGLPDGVVNFVYGVPADISAYLIAHPVIRKLSFTGSVPVGKHLAALAGAHMKPATMELGGHAPVLVFADADIEAAAKIMSQSKFRNAGQVCVSPTRFLIEERAIEQFTDVFVSEAAKIKAGPGLDTTNTMGPLVSERRLEAVESLVTNALEQGAKLASGGKRIGNSGNFYEPTVLTGIKHDMRIMNEEPFGPVALMIPFNDISEALEEANRLPFGLASYAFTKSAATISALERGVEAGMLSVNHLGLALPETPFGGVKDSGYGSEGGSEAIEPYLTTKFVSERHTL